MTIRRDWQCYILKYALQLQIDGVFGDRHEYHPQLQEDYKSKIVSIN